MLSKPDTQVTEALYAMRSDPRWVRVRQWLDENNARLHENVMVERNEIALRWIQGALQVIGDLTGRQDQAQEILHKIREHRGASGSSHTNT